MRDTVKTYTGEVPKKYTLLVGHLEKDNFKEIVTLSNESLWVKSFRDGHFSGVLVVQLTVGSVPVDWDEMVTQLTVKVWDSHNAPEQALTILELVFLPQKKV